MYHRSLPQIILSRAASEPEREAFVFLPDGEREGGRLTYASLAQRATALGSLLSEMDAEGERVLLVYPPGLDYVVGVFGAMFAGAMVVPCYPPPPVDRGRELSRRLEGIVTDAKPRVALAPPSLVPQISAVVGPQVRVVSVPEQGSMAGAERLVSRIDLSSLAVLQYTSGSTAEPRGVMLTHANLLHNLAMLSTCLGVTPETRIVMWVPPYHDMGLVGGILLPVYGGYPAALMPPLAFLQRPARWLEAITRYRATLSAAPNFAYALCTRRVSEADRQRLDLSSWETACNGAEPISAAVIERFHDTFAPVGFRREAMFPCYGLAEATLIVSGGPCRAAPRTCSVDAEALEAGRIEVPGPGSSQRVLTSSGRPVEGEQIAIVDPGTGHPSAPGEVGEIWVSGPNVGVGYWGRAVESEITFGNRLAGRGGTAFLRTGDLGLLVEDQLFVTGRLKDLIIVRGRNHYPQDLETSAELGHAALRPGGSAAFAYDAEDGEQVALVAEVEPRRRDEDLDALSASIRQAVALEHGVHLQAVVLVRAGGVPKTSSGKVQRSACRAAYLAGQLPVLHESRSAGTAELSVPDPESRPRLSWETVAADERRLALERYLRRQLAHALRVDEGQVEPEMPIARFGLDSLTAAELRTRLEAELGIEVPATAFLEDHSISEFAAELAARMGTDSTRPVTPAAPPIQLQDPVPVPGRPDGVGPRFSLFFFAADESSTDVYRLYLDAARFADDHDFHAVWTPERHFHPFGGAYPSPAVLSAALAVQTRRVRLRAGSVVLPLHDPLRVAEEWAVVDRLSGGRVDLAFARGWNVNDFVLSPASYARSEDVLFEGLEAVRRLWRGEPIVRVNGRGEEVKVRVHPKPVQREVDVWITCSGGEERFRQAGALGANVLTALLFQSVDELAAKLQAYREGRAMHGHDPHAGQVTLMLHTFLGRELEEVRRTVRDPFIAYLRTSVDLWRGASERLDTLSDVEQQAVLDHAFERYFRTHALFGTPQSCLGMVERLHRVGVTEIACLIDFGISADKVLASLEVLDSLRKLAGPPARDMVGPSPEEAAELLSELDTLSNEEIDQMLRTLSAGA